LSAQQRHLKLGRSHGRRTLGNRVVRVDANVLDCGFKETFDIIDERGLHDFAARVHNAPTTLFARIAIRTDEPPRVLPPRDGALLKTRFRRAIGAE
jgi:hypothetical protein